MTCCRPQFSGRLHLLIASLTALFGPPQALSRSVREESIAIKRDFLPFPFVSECPPRRPGGGELTALFAVHEKDLPVLEWSVRSLACQCADLRRVVIVSARSKTIMHTIEVLQTSLPSPIPVQWMDEAPFLVSAEKIRSNVHSGKQNW